MASIPSVEILQLQKVRLFSWNMRLSSDVQEDGQILFLIKSRTIDSTATSNGEFTGPIRFNFPFNLDSLSTKNDVKKLVRKIIRQTKQFKVLREIFALANNITEFLVKNYSLGLGLETSFSNPDSPKLIIVVEVNQTLVSEVGILDKVGILDQGNNYEGANEGFIEILLRNLMNVPVSSLKPVDGSERMGLTQVPGLDSFQPCELMAGDDHEGTCAICLEGFSGNSCFKMRCSHVFHGDCITKWLWRKRSCPMCRSRLS
ncbi:Zinc finger, RING-type [Corchorus capsularis]|uniref:Zinc finger, RING-type n=1 Tax=Corchorus capsularis TaxID=210143 RepID=A0A1R3HBR7_COCAP|nr:Zinc finger, RING-type [Corchorus capsularis]